jgi:hypothetical protein
MSAIGTKRTIQPNPRLSAIGVKADMSPEERNRASSAPGKSFSMTLEESGSIGIANTVLWKTLLAKSIA